MCICMNLPENPKYFLEHRIKELVDVIVYSEYLEKPDGPFSVHPLFKNLRFLSYGKASLPLFSVNLRHCGCTVGGDGSGSEVNSLKELKYVWGDALDQPDALGPDGKSYPWEFASKIAGKQRIPRSLFSEEPVPLIPPEEVRKILLSAFEGNHLDGEVQGAPASSFLMRNSKGQAQLSSPGSNRQGRSRNTEETGEEIPPVVVNEGCVPTRLCPTTYNTTAPMYGISLTSGQPVTIVQKFPDLLQQVVYQVCKTEECDVIHGQCVQTYLPYLFLVIPLGPVTLTGQDYVLVESGCACKPKYAKRQEDPPPLPFIQPFNSTKPRTNKRF